MKELTQDDRERIVEYLKISNRASRSGKYELLRNLPANEKAFAKEWFTHFRKHGIFVYLSRADELIFRCIVNFNTEYDWDTEELDPDQKEIVDYKEWLKCIDTLLAKKRTQPESEKVAEQAIKYMRTLRRPNERQGSYTERSQPEKDDRKGS